MTHVLVPFLLLAVLGASASAATLETCLASPASADCSTFEYPASSAQASLLQLCNAKPQLAACTTYKVCQNQAQASTLGAWCDTFTLLGSACADSASIGVANTASVCGDFNKLCTASSAVPKCKGLATITGQGYVNSTYAQYLVNSMCSDMEMLGCNCTTTDNSINPTCETLNIFTEMCLDMPGMRQCSVWKTMCSAAAGSCFCTKGSSCVPLIGVLSSVGASTSAPASTSTVGTSAGSSDWENVPPMAMYFHTGLAEYFLFKGWVPRNAGQYAGSLVAVFLMAFIFEGVVVGREVLEYKWTISEAKRASVGDPYFTQGLLVDIMRFSVTFISVGLGYWVMLLTMTFNAGVFVCCVLGIAFGSVIFRRMKPADVRGTTGLQECC